MDPLSPSLRPLLLPEVAAKIALGAETGRNGEAMLVRFEGETVALAEPDFDLAARAARRLKVKLGETSKGSAGALRTLELARKFIAEEIFKPGAVRVLYYPSRTQASAYYRCGLPALVLQKGEKTVAHLAARNSAREALDYDVVVIQIDHSPATLSFVRGLRDLKKKVIYEIDDAWDALEPWHPQYEAYADPETQGRIRTMMRSVDCVTVTTRELARRCRPYARRVEIVPNRIDLSAWPKADPPDIGVPFTILWAGSQSHLRDLEVVRKPLSEFMRAHTDARFVLFGRHLGLEGLPADRVRLIPFVPFTEYPVRLAEIRAHVAIAPLAQVPFNRAKSSVKAIEYAATGYPVVASDVGPYQEVYGGGARHGGILASDEEDWRGALETIYNSRELRDRMASEGRAFVSKEDAMRGLESLENLFTSLIGE